MQAITTHTLPRAAENFDKLPDSALIGSPTVQAVTGKSRATIWRWINSGILPKPKKLGSSQNLWTVGEIRSALNQAA